MSFTDRERLTFSLLVNVIGGLLVGYCIGYVPVALTMHTYLGNCTRYESENLCNTETSLCNWQFKFDEITWTNRTGYCAFKDSPYTMFTPTGCNSIHDSGVCGDVSVCVWDFGSKACRHQPEWEAWKHGFYAGMMIVGGMIGSFGATWLLQKLGRKRVICLTGITGIVATVFLIIGWQVDPHPTEAVGSYWTMAIGRLIVGIAVGLASVVCPMYCGEMAPTEWASVVGCTFQLAVTFGIFFAALIGYFLELTKDDAHLRNRFQAVNAIALLFPLILIPVSFVIGEPVQDDLGTVNSTNGSNHEHDESRELIKSAEIPLSSLKRNFVIAIALAAAQQLTGINAIMNYAPQITASFGMKPLEGNMVVMLWNWVTTIASIFIARKFAAGHMYCTSAVVASLACLLTAIPTYPGVIPDSEEKARSALTGVGIFVFVAAFEMGMGPAFYVLAQSIFPSSRRSFGCSFTVVVQFIFNLIINFCYPVAVQGLSGGASANQALGMAVVFIFFGVVGMCCTMLLAWNLRRSSMASAEAEDM